MFENGKGYACARCGLPVFIPAAASTEEVPADKPGLVSIVFGGGGEFHRRWASCPRCIHLEFTPLEKGTRPGDPGEMTA